MTIGERIYYCRVENHMTQKQLAEKIGIDPSTLRKYESGRLNPKIGTLRKIADALGCDVADLDDSLTFTIDSKSMNAVNEFVNSMFEQNSALSAASKKIKASAVNAVMTPELRAQIEQISKAALAAAYQTSAKNKPVSKEAQLLQHFRSLNEDGQSVAVDRVEELAQIPKYQRAQSDPQDAPAGSDDKEPAEK